MCDFLVLGEPLVDLVDPADREVAHEPVVVLAHAQRRVHRRGVRAYVGINCFISFFLFLLLLLCGVFNVCYSV